MRSTKYTLTFFTYVAIALTLALTTTASLDNQVQRRDHANLKRMIYKRIPLAERQAPAANDAADPNGPGSIFGDGSNNAAADPNGTTTTASAAATTTSAAATTSATTTTTSAAATSSSAATSSVTSSTQSSSASSSATSSSATSSSPSSSAPASTSTAAATTSSVPLSIPIAAKTSSGTGAGNTGVAGASTQNTSSGMSKTTVTILIIIASSIVGAGVIWTVIRKWKFRPSSDFDARMQPIDWNPSGADDDVGIPGAHRRHSGSSFQSGNAHSDNGNHLPVVPDHDFTAGPAQVGGYHDMSRGPAMQEMGRGPAMYAQYPQQGYTQNDAYGGHY